MKEKQQHKITGAIGGLIVGGIIGTLIVAIVLTSMSKPTTIQNILPLSFACAIVASVAGYFIKSIGKAFSRILWYI